MQKYGFKYDHSQGYRDFQPFYARVGDTWNVIDYTKKAEEWMHPLKHGKEIDLVEIGANWYVDDLPPMMFMKKAPNSHGFVNPRDIEDLWRDAFDWVYREMDYGVFAFTIHPDVSGRPQVLLMLERLIEHINGKDGTKWMTFEEIAEDFRKRYPFCRQGASGGHLSVHSDSAGGGRIAAGAQRSSIAMCSSCGFPAAPGHWTEAGAATPHDRLRARFRRAQVLQSVLPAYGLTAHDGAQVPGIQLGTLSGNNTIVRDLEEVWAEAERLSGKPIDPLDPRFIGEETT